LVRYKKAPTTGRIEDRRGQGGGRRLAIGGGGIGLGGLLVLLLINVCMGGGLGDLGGMVGGLAPAEPPVSDRPIQTIPPSQDPQLELREYMEAVYVDNDLMWEETFAVAGRDYRPPRFVFFDGFTESACGGADERVGPHYCPLDETIYLDMSFFQALRDRFGASGDLAPAYVVSHEFAHHIQTVLGISEQVRSLQTSNPDMANDLSIWMELQADCFAGVWLSTLRADETQTVEEGYIEIDPGETIEALEAAAAIGDDRIQAQSTGMVNPETWTHGSSEQRAEWLQTGIDTGDPGSCNTFDSGG
jgi:predicted metalloprotease